MTVIVDSSFIYSLFSRKEPMHYSAVRFAISNTDKMLIPTVIFPEVSYLFVRDFGYGGIQVFLRSLQAIDAKFVDVAREDLSRIRQITETYASAEFDIVDCCIMALAERLQIRRIATFDRRDFSIFRPRHCDFLELLPQ